VTVEASSADKTYIASGSTSFAPQAPEIVFYEDNPLYGVMYNKALSGQADLRNEEIKLVAAPYFASVDQQISPSNLTYNWSLNNVPIESSTSNSSMTFRKDKGTEGVALVSLQIANTAKIFQYVTSNLSLDFTKAVTTTQF
jgi:hypothetical protein